ncbi:Fc.00g054950.m01.CDS01 [Cosmosporella sp. VM-42]
MSYTYKSLAHDQIRILSIEAVETTNSASSNLPIICSLESIHLPPVSEALKPCQFKGDNYIWPELYTPFETRTIFRQARDPRAQNHSSIPHPDLTNLDGDRQLAWRHEWGDFLALSYAWGPAAPTCFILLDGVQFPVRPNLFEALDQLRRSRRIQQGFKLWVDAICINQNDLTERGQQVARMRDIYVSAWQVVTWLGPAADDSSLAMTALHWMSGQAKKRDPLEGFYQESRFIDARPLFVTWPTYRSPLRKEVYKALFFFLSRPYWRRMWILQEAAMARADSPVICGNKCLAWEKVYDSALFIAKDESRFGREIIQSIQATILPTWSFEFARDRVVREEGWASERLWKLVIAMMDIQNKQHATGYPTNTADLVQALVLGRDANVTDEKDRVYGLLGIRAIADRIAIVPDYSLSLPTIYTRFTISLLSAGDLNTLRLVSRHAGHARVGSSIQIMPRALKRYGLTPVLGPLYSLASSSSTMVGTPCLHEIPSWAVCWTCKPAPTAPLRGSYCAGGSHDCAPGAAPTSNLTLKVRGIIFDTINSLGAFHPEEVESRYPLNTSRGHCNAYGDLDDTRAAFWRTIVGDTTERGGIIAPEVFSWLLDPRLWQEGVAGVYANGFGLSSVMARNRELIICGYTLEELIFGPDNCRNWWQKFQKQRWESIYNPDEMQREALSWAINAIAWRRLMGTENGRMGLGPPATRAGDSIALLLGCDTPIILRKSEESWTVVGECYVHGAMYGEMLLTNKFEVGDIKLR